MPGSAAPAPRHALLRVDPGAWTGIVAALSDGDEPLIAGWADKGWPLVARRRAPADPPDAWPAGLPLPPSHGKRRLMLALPPGTVTAVAPPLALSAVVEAAPGVWRTTIEALLALGDAHRCAPRVFGSFALAALTGLNYIGVTSDLDLLWQPAEPLDLDRFLAELSRIDRAAPGRLDGEIVAHGGYAVNWREMQGGDDEILVKTSEALALRPARWLRDRLASPHEAP